MSLITELQTGTEGVWNQVIISVGPTDPDWVVCTHQATAECSTGSVYIRV